MSFNKLGRCIISALVISTLSVSMFSLPSYADEVSISNEEGSSQSENVYQLGDIDMNGRVDSYDSLLALRSSVGLDMLSNMQKSIGDINKDDIIDSYDSLSILRLSVNLDISDIDSNESKGNDENKDTIPSEPRLERLSKPIKGIDISFWQGNVDFKKVKESGVEFIILRAGHGTLEDTKFEEYYREAKKLGFKLGAYWYSEAWSEYGANLEADKCLDVIRGKQFDYPIFYDLENQYQFDLGKDFCSLIMDTFCSRVRNGGYHAGFYMSTFYATHFLSEDIKTDYDCWVAQWKGNPTYEWEYTMWQYGTTYVDGIKGEVDGDICYVDYPKYIELVGGNGY